MPQSDVEHGKLTGNLRECAAKRSFAQHATNNSRLVGPLLSMHVLMEDIMKGKSKKATASEEHAQAVPSEPQGKLGRKAYEK